LALCAYAVLFDNIAVKNNNLDLNPTQSIADLISKKPSLSDVFFVGCGGSLVDFYPAHYLIQSEGSRLHASIYPSAEFLNTPPRRLDENSVTIACSHNGTTRETLAAAALAKERGSTLVTLTHKPGSPVEEHADYRLAYPWGAGSLVSQQPMAIGLTLASAMLASLDGYTHIREVIHGLESIDAIVNRAVETTVPRAREFAQNYQAEPLLYAISSGASWAQAYSFAAFAMMEMQHKHASYIHSGDFFHGAFELVDENTLYVLLLNEGKTRPLDERVLSFLQRYAAKIEAIDARGLGISAIDPAVVDFFNPLLFYSMMTAYRDALAEVRGHPVDTRRYMWKIQY
jgi:fructoselysine-6-P-deglycase FrlB-like protein